MRQVRSLLRARTWPDGGASVFANQVYVTERTPFHRLRAETSPLCHIWCGTADVDPNEPQLVKQELNVRVYVLSDKDTADDDDGEGALIGTATTATTSTGRAISEICEQVVVTIRELGPDNGIRVQLISTLQEDISGAAMLWGASRTLTFEADIVDYRHYPPCSRLTGSDSATPDSADLAWSLAPSRFDRDIPYIEYASGATAPATVGSGTAAQVLASTATSATVDVGATGQYSFSLWQRYDESPSTTANRYRYSDPVSVTVTIS
jgi:hypothetical protein